VWVNSASSIGFKSRFDGKYRVVDLVGEAYFEVAKNAEQPFVVRTNNMDVRVLSTHFNIKAYPDETHTYATLNEGKIQVSKGELNEILAPGQQLSLNNSTKEFTREEVDASIYSAWVRGKFVFKDERLDDILNALSRWYDVKIFYQDQNLQDDRFSLSVNRYDDIETLLNHLRLIGGVDFEVNDGVLVVK
jgi:ferric-dicitrate binding protein FerR (iron transport regulator)